MNKLTGGLLLLFVAIQFQYCTEADHPNDGLKIVYFEDGKTIKQSIEYKNGRKNGIMKEFYNTGILKGKQSYINDTLNDTSAMYLPNGQLSSLHVYKNKLKHGCWKEYNKNGKLYSEIFFKNGLLDSTSSVYTYRTGRLLTRVTYKDGIKNGAEEKYYANGKPMSKVYYDLGRPCAGTEEWYDNGKKVDNNFKITVTERNELLLKGKVTYLICPEKMKDKDRAYVILPPAQGSRKIEAFKNLKRVNGGFELEYTVPKGGYIMTTECIAIFRETSFRNTFIKIHSFNVAINHY